MFKKRPVRAVDRRAATGEYSTIESGIGARQQIDASSNADSRRVQVAPREGRSIAGYVKPWTPVLVGIRNSLSQSLGTGIGYDDMRNLATHMLGAEGAGISTAELASILTCIWLVAASSAAIPESGSLESAVRWFCSGDLPVPLDTALCTPTLGPAMWSLINSMGSAVCVDLTPYLLETLEGGETQTPCEPRRSLKRRRGLFYTPPDLAHLLVQEAIREANQWTKHVWLDPACGSGVLLRAIMEVATEDLILKPEYNSMIAYASHSLYGIDVSPFARYATAFVLFQWALAHHSHETVHPLQDWRLLASNITVADTRSLLSGYDKNNPGGIVSNWPRHGFDHLVCNPPFGGSVETSETAKGTRDAPTLSPIHEKQDRHEPYETFVRASWLLTEQRRGSAAIVVPLSLMYSRARPTETLRHDMDSQRLSWSFASFDRSPDSLFGDNVKVRATVVSMRHLLSVEQRDVRVTGLQRWSSRSRSSFLKQVHYVSIGSPDLSTGIPRIGTPIERDMLDILEPLSGRFNIDTNVRENLEKTYVAKTAYNWIGSYVAGLLPSSLASELQARSHVLCLPDSRTAMVVAAMLSSRLTYWLWRVYGDGFHVSLSFLSALPFGADELSQIELSTLASAYQTLWQKAQLRSHIKRNAGVDRHSFAPYDAQDSLDAIDQILISRLGLPSAAADFLRAFAEQNVAAGRCLSKQHT